MTRALVTGATGFIGRHLVRALAERGHEITCLVRETSNRAPLEPYAARFAVGNINDAESMREPASKVDVVYHLAALLKAPWRAEFLTTNADGTRKIAEACRAAANPPTLIVVSSLAAAGPSPIDQPRTEDDPPQPVSKYGRSKLNGELAARELAAEVPTTIIRPPMVFGEHDQAARPLFKAAARGMLATPTLRKGRLSMVYVGDLADAMIAAADKGERIAPNAQSDPGTGVYFVAYDRQPTFHELGALLGDAVGRRVRVVRTPSIVTKLVGAAAGTVARLRDKPSILNADKTREATAGSWICSIEKAKSQLDFAPREPVESRLHQTAKSYGLT